MIKNFIPAQKVDLNLEHGKRKPIVCINTGDYYESTMEATKAIGAHPGNITHVLKGRLHHVKGFAFRYATKEEIAKARELKN